MLRTPLIIFSLLIFLLANSCKSRTKGLPADDYMTSSFFDSLKLHFYDSALIETASIQKYTDGYVPNSITFADTSGYLLFYERCHFNKSGFDGLIQDTSLIIDTCELGKTVFRNSQFHGTVSIMQSILTDPYFLNSTYDSLLIFVHDTLSYVDFVDNKFKDDLIFYKCKFTNHLKFSRDDFTAGKGINLSLSTLPDTIVFSSVKMGPVVDFEIANLNERTSNPIKIEFIDCDLTKFKFDYQHFSLLFDLISDDDKEGIYEGILNNFKTRGQLESYKNLDIEYRGFKFRQNWYTYPLSWINLAWWNYGYTKSLVFAWTAIFLLLFTPITYKKLDFLTQSVYEMQNIPYKSEMKRKIDKWWYSFIYTSSIFFRLTLKLENLKFTDKRWTAYVILVYTLGIVCLAYMANFVLQK